MNDADGLTCSCGHTTVRFRALRSEIPCQKCHAPIRVMHRVVEKVGPYAAGQPVPVHELERLALLYGWKSAMVVTSSGSGQDAVKSVVVYCADKRDEGALNDVARRALEIP